MANLIERATACDDGDRAARITQEALGIESDDVVNYTFPKTWPQEREQRAASSATGCERRRGFWPDATN